jgi:hypothetical protein
MPVKAASQNAEALMRQRYSRVKRSVETASLHGEETYPVIVADVSNSE